jgi:mono/diheme cytochrome c family protein
MDPPPESAPAETLARGHALYHEWCMFCHGIGVKSGGLLPDLRRAAREVYAPTRWQEIVISGVRADRGMPSFAGSLSREDAEAVRAYVISQAQRRRTVLQRGAALLSDAGTCVPARWLAD